MTKVLLVEDDNNLREIYEARLAAEGYEISTASDGEDALAVAKQVKPDLIISDVMMPRISGFEMLDILRNTDGLKDVKIIMLTALGQTEDKSRADNLGADRYLVKSQVTLEDIVKAADELLNPDAYPEAGEEALPAGVQPVAVTEELAPTAVPDVAAAAHQPTETPTPEPAVAAEPAPVAPAPQEPVAVAPDQPQADPIASEAVVAPAAPQPVASEPAADPMAAPSDPAVAPTADVTEPVAPVASTTDAQPEPAVAAEPAPVAPAPQEQQSTPPAQEVQATPEIPVAEPPVEPTVAESAPVAEPPTQQETDPVIQMPHAPDDPAIADATANVQSTSQESAAVEKQIESFVNNVEAAPAVDPATPSPEVAQPEPADSANETEHENLINSAASDLNLEQPTPEETAAETQQPAPQPNINHIPGQRVIQPPTADANRPDLDALLAQEAANEQSVTGGGQPVVGTNEPVQPQQPAVVSSAPTAPATPPSPAPVAPQPQAGTPQPGGVFTPNQNGSAHEDAL